MTREEELDWLYRLRSNIYVYMPKDWLIPMNNALDVAIKSLEQEQSFKWCTDCKEYDQEKHCCHRWSKVIRDTVEEMKQEQEPKPMVEIDLYSVIKQKYIEREVLDKIRAEIEYTMKYQYAIGDDQYAEGFEKSLEIIDKYKAESGGGRDEDSI